MKLLEERIRKDGTVKAGNVLKVDSFLNHQMDIDLFNEMGKEWAHLFADRKITKILTVEASGIGIACVAARHFDVPVVFAKKSKSINIEGDMYVAEVESFTHKCKNQVIVSKKFLSPEDHVLIIDDFLADRCQGLKPGGVMHRLVLSVQALILRESDPELRDLREHLVKDAAERLAVIHGHQVAHGTPGAG